MIQNTSINCSPMKPAVSFGKTQTAETLSAAADLMDSFEDGDLTEGKFGDLTKFSEKLSDGPFKTFLKIAGIAGASAIALKLGANKVVSSAIKNPAVNEKVVKPITVYTDKALKFLSTNLTEKANALKDKKGIKPFLTKYSNKAMEWVDTYGKRGTEEATKAIEKGMNDILANTRKSVIKAAKGKTLPEKEIVKLVEEKLAGTTKKALEYQALNQQKQFLSTENLIKKTIGNGAAIGAGTTAAVQANKDRDGDGIADIGQHNNDEA